MTLKQALLGVLVFTVIEVVTLGLWFHGSVPAVTFSTFGQVALIVGLYVEHFVSVIVGLNVGRGDDFYRWPF